MSANTAHIESLGQKLAEKAMTMLVRLCPEIRHATNEQLSEIVAAMRAKAPAVMDEFLTDAREAPWVADIAFQSAALSLAQAGINVLKSHTDTNQ